MINLKDLHHQIEEDGYNGEMIEAKMCQDIMLLLLSKSRFSKNITIKGGVVMSSISNNIRRATIDLDLDFIKIPLNNNQIKRFIKELNCVEGITIKIVGKIEKLRHQEYKGRRIYLNIRDSFNNSINGKLDIGVHKYMTLEQCEYCFDIYASDEGVSLLINSLEQIFTEKIKSLLKHSIFSTRYKDIYDIYFFLDKIDKNSLRRCFEMLIYKDKGLSENNISDLFNNIKFIFSDVGFRKKLYSSSRNWIDVDNDIVLNSILEFLFSLVN